MQEMMSLAKQRVMEIGTIIIIVTEHEHTHTQNKSLVMVASTAGSILLLTMLFNLITKHPYTHTH